MPSKTIHIVSFDNPYPPVYGGIVEVYSKLKPLYDLGISIYLHCFVDVIPTDYPELKAVCTKVFFYKTNKNPLKFLSKVPFSVMCRSNQRLLANLQLNDAPILFEGLKTAYLVHQNKLPNRIKILRMHNIEHDYFTGISASEKSYIKKFAYAAEAQKYRLFENVIAKFDEVIALSNFEYQHVLSTFGKATYIPVFHGNSKVEHLEGFGKFALYHGDLRLSDNLRVAQSLIELFKKIPDMELVIAGAANADLINKNIENTKNIRFVNIDKFDILKDLLRDAHINLIFSYQKSGTKLKLMTALFNSRFCIINDNIVDDQNVSALCEHANSDAEITLKILQLQQKPFNDSERRREVLETYMNDNRNAQLLVDQIWK
jgi:hypothetical protein